MEAVFRLGKIGVGFLLLSRLQLFADIETCVVGGGRCYKGRGEGWKAGRVLRQPRLSEDGVVGGEDGREEGGQDKEEVQQGRSSVRGINLKMKIIKTEIELGLNTFSFSTKNTFAPFIERHHDNHIIPMTAL